MTPELDAFLRAMPPTPRPTGLSAAYAAANVGPDCPRTLALFDRGQPIPDVKCRPSYSGHMPGCGPIRCLLCGEDR